MSFQISNRYSIINIADGSLLYSFNNGEEKQLLEKIRDMKNDLYNMEKMFICDANQVFSPIPAMIYFIWNYMGE